jgi:hypothetical protein
VVGETVDSAEHTIEQASEGRPTYKQEYAKQAAHLCKLGATDIQLAAFFEVSLATINNWKGRHREFVESLKVSKDDVNDIVERSLFQRAVGYTQESCKITNHLGVVTITPVVEHIAPDVTACIFWLKNRKPTEWRDQRHLNVNPVAGDIHDSQAEAIAKTYLETLERRKQKALDQARTIDLPARDVSTQGDAS